MKVLVTGAAGYIGSHTCVELLSAGHEVMALDDNFSNGHPAALARAHRARLHGGDPFRRLEDRGRSGENSGSRTSRLARYARARRDVPRRLALAAGQSPWLLEDRRIKGFIWQAFDVLYKTHDVRGRIARSPFPFHGS